MKKVLVPLAPGFEEIEAVAIIDILRRAGADVTVAGTVDSPITGQNRMKLHADISLDSINPSSFDMVVLPGGGVGTENLKKDARVKKAVEELFSKNKAVAAICAAPTVLSAIGITKDRTITSYPGARAGLKAKKISDERVVVDGNIITSQGPGTAIEFALKLVETLFGKDKAREVSEAVIAKD
ncbi:MAG: DJ-1/PfpI family protein [Deltaproteobacteria bacterium]|nr:DJ-1/PfpI family protein [Deltaproteobacteria bacterium]